MNAHAYVLQQLTAIFCTQIDSGKPTEDVFNDIKRVFFLYGIKVKHLFFTLVSINQNCFFFGKALIDTVNR